MKDAKELDGKAFYPSDLSKEELHNILKTMLKNGEKEEVEKILNQRTIVKRDGAKLKAHDYTEAFKEEFNLIANELEEAAKYSTNKDFNEYLILQAKALKENTELSAKEIATKSLLIASQICVFTNDHITVEEV